MKTMSNNDAKMPYNNRIVMIGFGSIGRALLPLLYQTFNIQSSQITIIAHDDAGIKIAEKFGVTFKLATITSKNYDDEIGSLLRPGDFLINVTYNVSTESLIWLCEKKGALYMDTSTEPWEEHFIADDLAPAQRTNYMLRENVLKIKGITKKTAIITHGANPGLISHFVKQALCNMAKDNGLSIITPTNSQECVFRRC